MLTKISLIIKSKTFITKEDAEKYTGDAEKQDEESQESPEEAYNPETGEINWDCPWYEYFLVAY
jgi:hypothetical protein